MFSQQTNELIKLSKTCSCNSFFHGVLLATKAHSKLAASRFSRIIVSSTTFITICWGEEGGKREERDRRRGREERQREGREREREKREKGREVERDEICPFSITPQQAAKDVNNAKMHNNICLMDTTSYVP